MQVFQSATLPPSTTVCDVPPESIAAWCILLYPQIHSMHISETVIPVPVMQSSNIVLADHSEVNVGRTDTMLMTTTSLC